MRVGAFNGFVGKLLLLLSPDELGFPEILCRVGVTD